MIYNGQLISNHYIGDLLAKVKMDAVLFSPIENGT